MTTALLGVGAWTVRQRLRTTHELATTDSRVTTVTTRDSSPQRHHSTTLAALSEPGDSRRVAEARLEEAAAEPVADGENIGSLVRKAIELRAKALDSTSSVDVYLVELKNEAHRKRAVTALEVEPGLAAIRNLAGRVPPGELASRERIFANEMAEMAARYRAEKR